MKTTLFLSFNDLSIFFTTDYISHFSGKISFCLNELYLPKILTFFLKGTVPRDFLPLVFFFKQLLLALVDKPSNDFDFFLIIAEIFDYFVASPVSTTPAMHALLVSLTLVNNSLPVSTTPVSDIFTVLEGFTGVNDTSKKFLTSVINTGKSMHLPVSMIPGSKYRQLRYACIAGIVDTVDALVGPLAVRQCL
jgi:hypothetical protein